MRKKLLLADDSVTDAARHRAHALRVRTCRCSPSATAEKPSRGSRIEKPDIILADIGMPKRSGYEVSAFVKSNPELEQIPCSSLPAHSEPVDDAKAKRRSVMAFS